MKSNTQRIHWFVKIAGGLLSVYFIFFFLSEGIEEIRRSPYPALLNFVPLLFLAIFGYGISWFLERTGAGIMMIAGAAMATYFVCLSDIVAAGIYGVPYVVLGALTGWSWRNRRVKKQD